MDICCLSLGDLQLFCGSSNGWSLTKQREMLHGSRERIDFDGHLWSSIKWRFDETTAGLTASSSNISKFDLLILTLSNL